DYYCQVWDSGNDQWVF
nr:immunoglobulin light chain junction region [Macaca mulatta]